VDIIRNYENRRIDIYTKSRYVGKDMAIYIVYPWTAPSLPECWNECTTVTAINFTDILLFGILVFAISYVLLVYYAGGCK
jgi:hypothetical protein